MYYCTTAKIVIYRLLLARLMGQYCSLSSVVCRRRLSASSSVTLTAAGRVGGRMADNARRATQITPHDSPGTLVSCCQNVGEIPKGSRR